MDLLDKLDNLELPAPKTVFPQEDYDRIATLQAEYANAHAVALEPYLYMRNSEAGAIENNLPEEHIIALYSARKHLGYAVDCLLASFIKEVSNYLFGKYPWLKSRVSFSGLSPVLTELDVHRRWSPGYIKGNKMVEIDLHREAPVTIDEIMGLCESAMQGSTFSAMQSTYILERWHMLMGTYQGDSRQVKLAKKKNYGSVVRFYYGRDKCNLNILAEMLGYFEAGQQWVAPIETIFNNDDLSGYAYRDWSGKVEMPERCRLIKFVTITSGGNVSIKFKDGHTAARFVREICKRDPDTCQ